jgi:ATP-dependent Zn protease
LEKENVTSGSSSDIEHATEFLTEMYKLNGMGQTPIRYSLTVEKSDYTYQKISQIEKNVKAAIEEAKILAENTLKNEKKLLLKLSDYLSEHSFMKKEQIKEFAQNYSTSKIDFIENGDFLYYREHLKSQVENLAPKPALLPHFESVIFMNKDE